MLILSTYALF